MNLSQRIVDRFAYPVTAPPFVPGMHRWADALVSGYQSTNLTMDHFQWYQNLVSGTYSMCRSMLPLTCMTPHLWLPLNYFTWFTPEWHRYLTGWLLAEESPALTVDGNIEEQVSLEFNPEIDLPSRPLPNKGWCWEGLPFNPLPRRERRGRGILYELRGRLYL